MPWKYLRLPQSQRDVLLGTETALKNNMLSLLWMDLPQIAVSCSLLEGDFTFFVV